jgi:hypothetical protein
MKRFVGAMIVTVLLAGAARAADDDKEAKAILDKAIKALGGEDKLAAVKAASWKYKGKITFGGQDNDFTGLSVVQGMDHFRQEFEGEFGGNKLKGVLVVNGDKGWRYFGENGMELDKNGLTNEKRNLVMQIAPITLVPLKGKDFKLQTAGEEKVDGKAAVGVKVTGPDGKDFKLFFDKESGLPVKMTAEKVPGFGGDAKQETTFGGYKEMDGIKKATKVATKRDGEKFLEIEVTEFKVLKEVDKKTFEEPK